MALKEQPPFRDTDLQSPLFKCTAIQSTRLAVEKYLVNTKHSLYLGFSDLPHQILCPQAVAFDGPVDGFFTLQQRYKCESLDQIITYGLRQSRFAPIIFWEVLHTLKPNGMWIDIDTEHPPKSAISEFDYLARPYFAEHLARIDHQIQAHSLLQVFKKTKSAHITQLSKQNGWTFGILTAQPSEIAGHMIRQILALPLDPLEIIVSGPLPTNAAADPRIRQVDLDKRNERGWITRKKNLIAQNAAYENLCILHDRFLIPANFAAAVDQMGPAFGIMTFPQVYYPTYSRTHFFRNVDFQCYLPDSYLHQELQFNSFRIDRFANPAYNDYLETAYACGGVYVAKKSIWNLVRQNEALHHAEWEDVRFGIDCARYGIPHRVNPHAVFESVNSQHFMLNAFDYAVAAPNGTLRSRGAQSSATYLASLIVDRQGYKPLARMIRADYISRIQKALSRLPNPIGAQIGKQLEASPKSTFQVFQRMTRLLDRIQWTNRDELEALVEFLSICGLTIWHNNDRQHWIDQIEQGKTSLSSLAGSEATHFLKWSFLYPRWFGAFSNEKACRHDWPAISAKPSVQRKLQKLHYKSLAVKNTLVFQSSIGLVPAFDLLAIRGELIHRDKLFFSLAVLLVPFEWIVQAVRSGLKCASRFRWLQIG